MKHRSQWPKAWLAFAAAACLTGGGIAALEEAAPDIWKDVAYYSTFDDPEKGLQTEQGEGDWNTTGGGALTEAGFVLSGYNPKARALNVASYRGWTPEAGQKVLSPDDTVFTIAFRAKIGNASEGMLFAFGSSGTEGGLSLRSRGSAAGWFTVSTGMDNERLQYEPSGGSDEAYQTYFIVYEKEPAEGNPQFALYVGAVAEPTTTNTVSGTVIAAPFQWGTRHGGKIGQWESPGNGALDTLGVWKRKLSAEERQAIVTEWETLAQPSSVKEKVAFADVPEGWGAAPSEAVRLGASANLELENIPEARQTLGDREANVAEIVASSGTPNVYGISGQASHTGDPQSVVERDVWLKVSGGTYGTIVGGKDNHWTSNAANEIHGNLLAEVTGQGTRAKNVLGFETGGGNGANNGALPSQGNALVTIADGAKVTGSIAGAGTANHGHSVRHTGDTTVRIRALQDETVPADGLYGESMLPSAEGEVAVVAGGALTHSDYAGNTATSYIIDGNTAVEVALAEGGGTFAKDIFGASRHPDAISEGDFTVTGSSSVTIDAPGVIFPNLVCAGGSGATAKVGGKATLTLKAGIFMGGLVPSERGASVGSSELVIANEAGAVDLRKATVGDFGTVTIQGDVALGLNRFANAQVVLAGGQTLTFTVTQAELDAGRISLWKAESVPEGLTIRLVGVAATDVGAWEIVEGRLSAILAPATSTTQQWRTGQADTWEEGLPDFRLGDNVSFFATETQETVSVGWDVATGELTIIGNYAFVGNGSLAPTALNVSKDGALAVSSSMLTFPANTAIDGTLTYDTAGATFTLPALSGSGTLVKTDAGQWTLRDGTAITPTIVVKNGTLRLEDSKRGGYADIPDLVAEGPGRIAFGTWTGEMTDRDATILLRDGGTFWFDIGNSYNGCTVYTPIRIENDGTVEHAARFLGSSHGSEADISGPISGQGLLIFASGELGNQYDIPGVISDASADARLALRFEDSDTVHLKGANTYSGGTTVVTKANTHNAEAFGVGDITIAEGGALSVNGTLNAHAAYANSGTVTGTINLCDGATLAADGSAAFDTLTVSAERVPITGFVWPEGDQAQVRVVSWNNGPSTPDAFVVEGLSEVYTLLCQEDGLYVVKPEEQAWATPADGATDWAAGLPNFKEGDRVTFGANAAQETVSLSGDINADVITIAGDYRFVGPGSLNANAVIVTETGRLTFDEGFALTVAQPVEVAGALGGHGTVAGAVAFGAGARLVVAPEGLTVAGAVTVEDATFVLDFGDLPLGDDTAPILIVAPEGTALTFPEQEGFTLYTETLGGTVRYALGKTLAQPWRTTLTESGDWRDAAWLDGTLTPFDSVQWVAVAGNVAEAIVKAEADVTLMGSPDAVKAFTVEASEHTLTLAEPAEGGFAPAALTVAGPLATSSAALTLPANAVIDGTLTYDTAEGATVTLPALSGSGTLVKTGSGTWRLYEDTLVEPTIVVKDGTLALPSERQWDVTYPNLPDLVAEGAGRINLSTWATAVADADATVLLREGGTLESHGGNTYAQRIFAPRLLIENDGTTPAIVCGSEYGNGWVLQGPISGRGVVSFRANMTHNYAIDSVVSDGDGEGDALALRFEEGTKTVIVRGANGYSGGTTVAAPVQVENAEAFGVGAITIAEGGTLTVKDTLNAHAAYANSGTVTGAINLCDGASLTVGTAVFDAVTVAEGATVPVTGLPEAPYDARLVSWTTGPASAEGFSVEGLPSDAVLSAEESGLYVRRVALSLTFEEGVAATEAQKALLVEAATEAGLTGEVAVRFAEGIKEPTLEALECFTGIVSADAEAKTLTVDYAFGITAIDVAGGQVSVTVKVSGAAGAAFREGAVVALVRASDAAGTLGEAVVAPADNGGVVTLAFPLPEGEDTVLFGARVTAPTTP